MSEALVSHTRLCLGTFMTLNKDHILAHNYGSGVSTVVVAIQWAN
jgi:hypothetical protein